MRRFFPAALSVLLALPGCASFDLFQPVATATAVNAPLGPAATVPRPAEVRDLATGIVEALGRGDLAQARLYYLSDEEFDALFSWSGPDSRPERNALIDAALKDAAPSLTGATFKGLLGPPSKTAEFASGRRFGSLVLKQASSALDSVSVVAIVGGKQRVIRLEGPIRVGEYWRLFSPTLEIE